MTPIEQAILAFDRSLRVFALPAKASRPYPAESVPDVEMAEESRKKSGGLMRVNHTGEICAQALYQSQVLFARQAETRLALQQAAKEEWDHLGWCAQRLNELGDRPSFLNPVWYAGSFLMGAASALAGDRLNMAFLVETERQVESHLNSHMTSLPHEDLRSRAIVETMREEEAAHAQMAESRGAAVMPDLLKYAMRSTARLMTTTAYWV